MTMGFLNNLPTRSTKLIAGLFITLTCATIAFSQAADRSKNNPYSPSPSIQAKVEDPAGARTTQVAFVPRGSAGATDGLPSSRIAPGTSKSGNDAKTPPANPTEIYKIGVGDVLFIDLKNAPSSSGYFTVKENGTIDYPLAGENIVVLGRTDEEVKSALRSRITLFSDPNVEVKVRHYASHEVVVTGLVENPGIKNLHREAIPLFVIKAEAGVSANATTVSISRGPSSSAEIHELRDAATDNVIIYPGSKVDFSATNKNSADSYFIAGEINASGQKTFTTGLTLFQAITASGGEKSSAKRATIRRRNETGTLTAYEHDLRAIRRGRSLDPTLLPGDMIEISK